MSQTILIDNDESSPYLFNFLSTYLKSNIIKLSNAEEAVELLEIIPQVPLIITRATNKDEQTARKLHQYLKDKKHPTTLLVMGVDIELLGLVNCLEEPINWNSLLKEATAAIHKDGEEQRDFGSVNIEHLSELKESPCEVYLRIKKGGEAFQYVKLLNPHQEIDHERLGRFALRDLKYLYVERKNIQSFMVCVANELMRELEIEQSVEERILTTARSHSFIRDILGKSEYEQSHFDLSESSVESMQGSVRNSPQISKLIRFLTSNKVTGFYKHAHLRSLMCHYVLSKQRWYRSEHLQVLSFISFYHGMALTSEEHLRFLDEEDLKRSQLTDEDKMAVLEQPKIIADMLTNHPGVTNYIQTVLMESQGNQEGVGLAGDPSEDLHPLSKVFIVADQFVKILLHPELPSTKRDILPLLSERLTQPSYQKIIQSLEQKFT